MKLSVGLFSGTIPFKQRASFCPIMFNMTRSPLTITAARLYSKGSGSSIDKSAKEKSIDRIHKIISKSRLLTKLNRHPKFRQYFDQLAETSPLSTITSFLILHEITAIGPLFGLWWILYTLNLNDQYELPVYFTDQLNRCGDAIEKLVGNHYDGFDRNRLILSGAISYAIIKVLYPARVLLSLWGAPYLLKWVVRPFKRLRQIIKKRSNSPNVK